MKKTEALLAPSSILPRGGGGRTTKMLYRRETLDAA